MKVLATAVVVLPLLSSTAFAQESKSAPLAKQLAAALDAAKLDCVAAKDPSAPDVFVAALYFPGVQLLVVSGKYSVPQLLNERLAKKEYRDTYLDLNGASVPASKFFLDSSSVHVVRPAASGCRRSGVPEPWHEMQRAWPGRSAMKIGWTLILKNS